MLQLSGARHCGGPNNYQHSGSIFLVWLQYQMYQMYLKRSTCVQVHVPTCGGIARFVVVWERFCVFGRIAWRPQKSPHALSWNRAFRGGFGTTFRAFLRCFSGFAPL